MLFPLAASPSQAIIRDFFNSVNIFQAEKLEFLLQGIIGAINENTYRKIEVKKSKYLEDIHYLQDEVLTNYHNDILHSMEVIIGTYKEDLNLYTNFHDLK